MLRICPNCGERYMVDTHTGDYVHQCNSKDLTIDEEDIKIYGNYTEDNTTTDTTSHSFNKVQSNNPDDKAFTDRGNNKLNYRQRQHMEYIGEPNKNERTNN